MKNYATNNLDVIYGTKHLIGMILAYYIKIENIDMPEFLKTWQLII